MAEAKTKPTHEDVEAFLAAVPEPARADSHHLVDMMSAATGEQAVMWGGGMVGFGHDRLRYASGREVDCFRIGFAPRKKALTLYLYGGLGQHGELLARLGPHTTGKGCLYVKRLDDVDREVLAELITAAAADPPVV